MTDLPVQQIRPTATVNGGRLLKNLRDYADAVFSFSWQRQGTFVSMAFLTAIFFDVWFAALFFAINILSEIVELLVARKVTELRRHQTAAIRSALVGFVVNAVVSASAISLFAIWVAIEYGGVAVFTALFSLFAAALYAAMNNHQLVWALSVRLVLYSCAFFFITVKDLWLYSPPITSQLWLQFFTVVMVVYFLIDCSIGFLRQYRKNLDHMDDLKVEHERTKAALVVKSQFVSVVSHELRTPLTSIKGSLDLINSGRIGTVNPQFNPLFDMATKNSRRLAHLIDDLLDIQKIEAGEMTFKRDLVDVKSLIAEAIKSNIGEAATFNVTIRSELQDAETLVVQGDETRFMQVMTNMISNAAKFSPDGAEIVVGAKPWDGGVRIFVRDFGAGIPPGSEEKVFGRFSQLDSSDQRHAGGTGLGMNISREIVEAMAGTIHYESKIGEGTTFFVDLPLAACQTTSAGTKAETNVVNLARAANG